MEKRGRTKQGCKREAKQEQKREQKLVAGRPSGGGAWKFAYQIMMIIIVLAFTLQGTFQRRTSSKRSHWNNKQQATSNKLAWKLLSSTLQRHTQAPTNGPNCLVIGSCVLLPNHQPVAQSIVLPPVRAARQTKTNTHRHTILFLWAAPDHLSPLAHWTSWPSLPARRKSDSVQSGEGEEMARPKDGHFLHRHTHTQGHNMRANHDRPISVCLFVLCQNRTQTVALFFEWQMMETIISASV